MPSPRPADFDYQRYLASREWALLKEQVRKRSGDICERCLMAPYQETHHLTYARIGHEDLADLLAVCKPCHQFLSGKSDIDPCEPWITYDVQVEDGHICCPGCFKAYGDTRGYWLHISGARHDREHKAGSYGAAVVEVWCEWGHKFDLILADHKGLILLCAYDVKRDERAEL